MALAPRTKGWCSGTMSSILFIQIIQRFGSFNKSDFDLKIDACYDRLSMVFDLIFVKQVRLVSKVTWYSLWACLRTLLNRDQSLRSSPIYFNGVFSFDLKRFGFGKFVLCLIIWWCFECMVRLCVMNAFGQNFGFIPVLSQFGVVEEGLGSIGASFWRDLGRVTASVELWEAISAEVRLWKLAMEPNGFS